jgi:hypothetical protein
MVFSVIEDIESILIHVASSMTKNKGLNHTKLTKKDKKRMVI